jgi:tryptophanyl-tRNA synthetase
MDVVRNRVPQRVLTGIKPTGTPHIGNLLGAIRPAIDRQNQGCVAMYFIADHHALTTVHPPKHKPDELRRLTYEVAATWLAAGLDPERTLFYRQSDIPELFELSWIFACFTSKGWMNKAHSYKDHVAKAMERGETDVDADFNMGQYTYPILMAADIVAFDVDIVPVGKDQLQHVEIARDIAQRINHAYGKKLLRLPKAEIDDNVATVPGIDGKKMSKSYDNVIPIFGSRKAMKDAVNRILTDSTPPEAPKDPDQSIIFAIYKAVATPDETRALAERFRAGIGWGDAKTALLDRIESEVGAARSRYEALMADTTQIDALLEKGAAKARPTARATLDRLRSAIGIAR